MAFKHYVLLCIVLASSFFITSDALPASHHLFHRLQKRSGLRLCGSMLVEALATVCQSEYYAPTHVKRTFDDNSDWDAYSEGVLERAPLDEYFNMNQLSRRGVADECCIKSCTIGQLASYCGPIPRK